MPGELTAVGTQEEKEASNIKEAGIRRVSPLIGLLRQGYRAVPTGDASLSASHRSLRAGGYTDYSSPTLLAVSPSSTALFNGFPAG